MAETKKKTKKAAGRDAYDDFLDGVEKSSTQKNSSGKKKAASGGVKKAGTLSAAKSAGGGKSVSPAKKTGSAKKTSSSNKTSISRKKTGTVETGTLRLSFSAFNTVREVEGFLSLMSGIIPPLAGVMIAHYWIICKGKRENFKVDRELSVSGLIAFLAGALVACITGGTFANFPGLVAALPFLDLPFFVGPVNGIVVSLVLYVALTKAMQKKA